MATDWTDGILIGALILAAAIPCTAGIRHPDQATVAAPHRRTFPARLPLLALDRIWVRPRTAERVEVHASAASRTASDHLPLTARLTRGQNRPPDSSASHSPSRGTR